jgi:hypothetical protein
MGERKLIELELEVKEIILPWEIDISQIKTKLHIKEATKWINYQDSSSIRFQTLEPDTTAQMWVIYDEDLIGMAGFKLEDYMGKELIKTEVWVKLSSPPDGPFVFESEVGPKLRLGLSTKEFVLPSRAPKPVPILIGEDYPGQNSKCPYLSKIAQAQMIEKQSEENVFKIRESVGAILGFNDDGSGSPTRSPTRSPQRNSPSKSGLEGTYLDELIEVEVPCRFNLQIDRLTDEEQKHMKNIVLALLHKTKVLQLQVAEIDAFTQQIETNTASQNDLTESMNETEEQLNTEATQVQSVSSMIQNEFPDLDSEIVRIEVELDNLQSLLQKQKTVVEPLDSENSALKSCAGSEHESEAKEIQELLVSFESSESNRDQAQVELEKFIKESSKKRDQKVEQLHNLVLEKEHLLTQIQSSKNNIDRYTSENRQLTSQLLEAQGELLLNTHLKQKYTIEQKLVEPDTQLLHSVLENLVNERCDQIEAQKNFEDSIADSAEVLRQSIQASTQEAEKLEEELQEIEKKMPGMEANQNQLTHLVGNNLDIEASLSSSKTSYENALRDRDRILSELTYLGDFTLQNARTSLQCHRIKDKLKVVDTNKQLELNGMRKLVIDEKRKNPIYKPDMNDPVDIALYEFLNRNKVSVPFVKEFNEVYLFGTRRIQVKLDNDQLQVKVGGGYLPIPEFVKTFEQAEFDKVSGNTDSSGKTRNALRTSSRKSSQQSSRPSSRQSSRAGLSPALKSSRPQSGASTPNSKQNVSIRSKK